MLIIFNKPFGVLCQFTGEGLTSKEYINVPGIYPAGQLDKDSEGLLILTDDGRVQDRLAHPKYGKHKIYWIQVDRTIDAETCQRLKQGIQLNDGPAHAIRCHRIDSLPLPDREPPVRVRKNISTSWIEMTLNKGRNRQIRRMTAAVGFPTLRLVRFAIGDYQLGDLSSGEYRVIEVTRVKSAHAKQRHPSHRRHVRRR